MAVMCDMKPLIWAFEVHHSWFGRSARPSPDWALGHMQVSVPQERAWPRLGNTSVLHTHCILRPENRFVRWTSVDIPELAHPHLRRVYLYGRPHRAVEPCVFESLARAVHQQLDFVLQAVDGVNHIVVFIQMEAFCSLAIEYLLHSLDFGRGLISSRRSFRASTFTRPHAAHTEDEDACSRDTLHGGIAKQKGGAVQDGFFNASHRYISCVVEFK